MDIQELMGQILGKDSVKNLSKVTKTSQKDVKNVLTSALPSLVSGLQTQANGDTAESFATALNDHAKVDTSSIKSFMSGVDIADGGKIVAHLLGGSKETATKEAAEKAGVAPTKAGNILSAAAPLLLSLVGQQSGGNNTASGVSGMIGSLIGNADLGSIVSGLASGSSGNSGGLLGGLLGLFKKK